MSSELTNEQVDQLCEVYCEGRMDADSYYSPFGKQGDDIQQAIRAGIRAVARELPRLPYQPPEDVTVQSLTAAIWGAQDAESAAAKAVEHLGITLPVTPMSLDEMREILNEANRWCDSKDESDNNVGMAIECLAPCVTALEAAIKLLQDQTSA